jgi:hypothetical protein
MEGVIAMLVFAAVPFAFSFLALRDAARAADKGSHATATAAAAEALALEPRERGFGRRLDDALDLEIAGQAERRQIGEKVVVTVRLAHPIATELDLTSRKAEGKGQIGISGDFDRRFAVKTRRVDRVTRLLKTRLGYELILADTAGFFIDLDQTRVRVTGRWITEIGEIEKMCDTATRLARLLIAAEGAQPELLPWPEVMAVWQHAAQRLGGQFDRDARRLVQGTPYATLEARPSSEREEHWFGELSVRLTQPLAVPFQLSDEQGRSLWQRVTVREVELADAAFDGSFWVSTPEPEALGALLDPELRGALVELERITGTITITEAGIEARFEGRRVTDADALSQTLDAALVAAEMLARAGSPDARGAYR